ncbi:CHAT domain-containing protein [Rivularia sp. UHCC 0363]|uniref:CHAT domain-containing protein n=1 Tax=Rivularia sp. UHCC 0363 TaxID=3110244 RepID=UPI002B1FC455|nr:CHAT domain-containing protein [Rivularia sp. UHCC 0363]MEA5593462.1 CHAT domain-containing protein [Rivularia sp. UHCC 0363]
MVKNRQYVNFNLELRDYDESNQTFKVSVPFSEVGETREAVTVSIEGIENQLSKLERKRLSPQELIELGKQLTIRLFPPGEISNLFQKAVERAGLEGGVRLRLVIKDIKLAQIPWEFCYLPQENEEDSYDNFLVLNPKYSMVRYESTTTSTNPIKKDNQESLRLLAVTANPWNDLDLDVEQEVIEKALDKFSVDGVTLNWQPFIKNPTVDELNSALDKKADLFHFAGHGGFKEEDNYSDTEEFKGMGNLVLLNKEKQPEYLPANHFAKQLQMAGVKVALLGACESGRRDGVSAWTGIAPALMKEGIPAVVAMQYKVRDDDAIVFSKRFYTALASGLSVDEAVSLGRLEMYRQSNERFEWGIPVLYMRSDDGIIFPELSQKESKTADELHIEGEARVKELKDSTFSVVAIEKVTKAKHIQGNYEGDKVENSDVKVVYIKDA